MSLCVGTAKASFGPGAPQGRGRGPATQPFTEKVASAGAAAEGGGPGRGGASGGGAGKDQPVQVALIRFEIFCRGRGARVAHNPLRADEVVAGCRKNLIGEHFTKTVRGDSGGVDPAGLAGFDQNPKRLRAAHPRAAATAGREKRPARITGPDPGKVVPDCGPCGFR